MTSEHAADEAGGEVIYSYDGDESPQVEITRPFKSSSSNVDIMNAEQDETAVSASQAFETFAGKIYAPPTATSFRGAFSSAKRETALERLGRLQQEIQQIEQDLLPLVQTTTTAAAGADAASGGGKQQSQEGTEEKDAMSSNLLLTVHDMKVRLARAAALPSQEALTSHIQTAVASLGEATTPSENNKAGSSSISNNNTISALENRLLRLERITGANYSVSSSSSNTTAASNESLSFLERLAALEETLSKVDDKELELKAKKAKVIRQDLEAAAKARNKLMAGGSSTSSSAVAAASAAGGSATAASDAKTISALHDQMVQLHGLTPHLPVLAQRLQALARQHQEAALQSAQLQGTQDLAHHLAHQVSQLEQALKATETAMKQSAQQMVQNMQALDEKFEAAAATK